MILGLSALASSEWMWPEGSGSSENSCWFVTKNIKKIVSGNVASLSEERVRNCLASAIAQ